VTTRKRDTGELPEVAAAPAQPEVPSMTDPPSTLSDAAKAWWKMTIEDYELEPHHVRLLSEAAHLWDRAAQARMLVDHDGLVVRDRFGQSKPHPAVAIERDARNVFVRIMRELDLDGVPEPESRPPRASRNRP
jgi:phage terminase small subunit